MIDEVDFCPRRNDEQWQARTVSAWALNRSLIYDATSTHTSEGVGRGVGLADNRRHHVVIPTVRIVICDDHGQCVPLRKGLQRVDSVDQEGLFIERGRVFSVAVLVSAGLEEADLWQVARQSGSPEIP